MSTPTKVEVEFSLREVNIAYMLGRGYRIQDIAKRYKVVTHYMDICVQRMYRKTGTRNKTHLVYWMLDQCYLEYPLNRGKRKPPRPSEPQLEAIELLAHGNTIAAIARQLGSTTDGINKRLGRAARSVGAANSTHLMAICWEQDWFV